MSDVDLSDESIRSEVVKNQESVINSLNKVNEDFLWVNELRNHLVKILTQQLKQVNKYIVHENNFYINKVVFVLILE